MSESRKRGRPRIHSPRKKSAKLGKGRAIRGQARELVCALREYFELERQNGGPLIDINKVVDRTAAALKISKNTVIRIGREKQEKEKEQEGVDEGQQKNESALLETPGKTKRKPRTVTDIDAFQSCVIRRHIYSYYERKEYPTVKNLHLSLQQADLFRGSESSLRNYLIDMGFYFEKYARRTVLMERNDIVAWRCRYLRSVKELEFENIIWLDETFVNAGHSLIKGWTDRTAQSTAKAPLGKGGRVIVLHAGSSHGFVPNCQLMFRSKKTSDYHEEMNAATFTEWFSHSLLQNIPPNSTIIMDNASYHSVILDKVPTTQSRKADILSWLERNVVPNHGEFIWTDYKKAELLEEVAKYKPKTPTYAIDEIAKQNGHRVIRLPPYHAHLNPIENIWAQVKGYVARNNKKFSLPEVERLAREGIERVTPEDWASVVLHVRKITHEAWRKDGIVDDCVDQFLIPLNSSDSSGSSSEEEETGPASGDSSGSDSSLGVTPFSS